MLGSMHLASISPRAALHLYNSTKTEERCDCHPKRDGSQARYTGLDACRVKPRSPDRPLGAGRGDAG